jgi:Protein of unknown function (DUF1549)/Protein of unknown function (DUF1553)/Planctomycete cytochrome C
MLFVRVLFRFAACSVWVAGSLTSLLSADEKRPAIDFNRDVRPILSKACYNCHGPDGAHRKAGLRLDERDAALKELETGSKAIIPGKPAASELHVRITSRDDAERMPPKDFGHQLTPGQIETLTRWISEGAHFAQHWSFVKPERPALPAVKNRAWSKNPIDLFVLARQEQAGLSPAPEADRHSLIRRLSFDLRGLPPTPAEVEAFVADSRNDAYDRLVERFLDDSAYGERWARLWLDLARYADSKGLGSDPLRTIWRYRDWVIDAFNRNLPFDQFTVEQLAGDLLPGATLDQRIATAFHRNTMTNTEGGTDDEEFRVAAVKDRVDTTTQVWMGLTMGCAKCHDHKFDPVTQSEYYQFYAFFNQTADNDQPDESPTIPAPTRDIESKHREVDAAIAVIRAQIDTPTPELAAAQEQWESTARVAPEWIILQPDRLQSEGGATFERKEEGSLLVTGAKPEQDVYTLTAHLPFGKITAYRLEVLPDPSLPGGGSGRSAEGAFVLSRFSTTVQDAERPEPPALPSGDASPPATQTLPLAQAFADFSQAEFPVASVLTQRDLRKGGWGVGPQLQQPHSAYFIPATSSSEWKASRVTVQLEHRFQTAYHTLGKFRLSVTTSPHALPRLSVPSELLAVIDLPREQRSSEQAAKLAAYYRTLAPALEPLREKIAQLEKTRPAIPTVPVMLELSAEKRRTTKVMVKGNFQMTGETVEARVPKNFHPLPREASPDRLGMATWIVDRNNPLTARVTVNRFWSQLFGTGIVETEEDFGTQGDLPSHPELLDWLAVEFMEGSIQDSGFGIQGKRGAALAASPPAVAIPQAASRKPQASADNGSWDMKRILKLIVTSATYRQSSQITGTALTTDPRNRLLTRGPRFRLEAEMVRDQALALGGLLSRKSHGPSVYPPQPPGLWQAAFNGERTWATSSGEDKYRRALYTLWRRTVPYPSMATFDAPSRELCTVRRIRTNTPLQAFVTLNDPVYVEAAQGLARRIVQDGGTTVADRARFGLQLCLARPPTTSQIEQLGELFSAELEFYRNDQKAAEQLATDPLGPLPEGMLPAEMAAWTVVANVLLNLDGVLTK